MLQQVLDWLKRLFGRRQLQPVSVWSYEKELAANCPMHSKPDTGQPLGHQYQDGKCIWCGRVEQRDIAPTPLVLGDQKNKRWARAMAQFNDCQKPFKPWWGHSHRHATKRRRVAANHTHRRGVSRSSCWQPCSPNGGR